MRIWWSAVQYTSVNIIQQPSFSETEWLRLLSILLTNPDSRRLAKPAKRCLSVLFSWTEYSKSCLFRCVSCTSALGGLRSWRMVGKMLRTLKDYLVCLQRSQLEGKKTVARSSGAATTASLSWQFRLLQHTIKRKSAHHKPIQST